MRFIHLILILILVTSCSEEDLSIEGRGLIINEFLASNDSCCKDSYGDYDDWVELYNDSNQPIDIGGMYFTDTPNDDKPYLIPSSDPNSTTIQPKGYLVIWCDDDQEQGALHVSKKLSKGGESIILLSQDKLTVVDSYTFPEQTTDISMGRDQNDFTNWIFFENPTPGLPNN